MGESSSPPKGLGSPGGHDMKYDIYARLLENRNEEALSNPDFREQFMAHFSRLPPSYQLDVNVDRAEDVLLHQKILNEAKDPEKCPVFHVRFMKLDDVNVDVRKNHKDIEDGHYLTEALSVRQDVACVPIHEIIFSTVDKPKLLSQLSALLSDIGLNIREAHVFSTTDGYSLDVFVVDGWPVKDTDDLHKELEAAISRTESSITSLVAFLAEYMPGGNLYDFLHKHHNILELSMLLEFALDVCEGMNYLHQNNIIHRDLKAANLLMDDNRRFQSQGGDMTAETGTYRWMAPEVINHQQYDQKADVFSFAIVLWELVTSKIPYDKLTPLQAALGVRQGLRPELPDNGHPVLLDLMQRCWEALPAKRPSFSEIIVELEELLKQVKPPGETSEERKENVTCD
ncbi:hypothetical protein J5N97_012011 [Dioscorea zingiberensis]|uniref:Uncharacterized protein n=1 Tax=Dioscorea zingiberensis TaxID=325984 RepID=A0A9D5CP28_9LILI|nr:hypothetical protein J5N97_012011 [Dioscorea zingiberensis]